MSKKKQVTSENDNNSNVNFNVNKEYFKMNKEVYDHFVKNTVISDTKRKATIEAEKELGEISIDYNKINDITEEMKRKIKP